MRATINGISMNYAISGPAAAPPVVLHHPLATDLTVWDELTKALEPSYRVIRFDARGHGKTDAPKGPYDFATLAADVTGLMDHLGIDKARYLGLSMGGFAGQVLGFTSPGRFHSLCLVSTSSDMTATPDVWNTRIATARKDGMSEGLIAGSMARWVAPAALNSKPHVVARLSDMVRTTPVEGYIGWCEAIRDFNVTARLGDIKLPTKVIVGALDPATSPAMAQIIHKGIAGSEYAEVPGTAHMLHVEEPEQFHAEVLPFMAKHGPKP
ncbi:MAG: alpha/beta fold hydrolase [Hyphomicrobiaceae bacterium]